MSAPRLSVHPEGRFFQTADGDPFFYLADTAWMLFGRLTLEDAERLFRNRVAKGFTVIQACVFRDLFEPNTPNVAGIRPFDSEEAMHAAQLSEAWLEHVATVVGMADELGLVMALLPTWGDKWTEHNNSAGPVIFNPETAGRYGRQLSDRLATFDNLVWILGGDSSLREQAHIDTLNSMAAGLRSGGAGDRLMSFHPGGGRHSGGLHCTPWLDFHGNQSGHAMPNGADYQYIEELSALLPTKPVIDIEPNYEVCPMFWARKSPPELPTVPLFNDYDVRKCCYRSVLAGGAGFTYGCDPIRQCLRPGDRLHAHQWPDMPPWFDVLDAPGAGQLQLLAQVLLERSYFTRVPAQELLTVHTPIGARPGQCSNTDPAAHIRVARCTEGSYLMVYIPVRQAIALDTSGIRGERIQVSIYHPEECRLVHRCECSNTGRFTFIPEWNLDCFLVLDAI